MKAVIRLNSLSMKYEGFIDGKLIKKGSRGYVKYQLKVLGVTEFDFEGEEVENVVGQSIVAAVPVKSEFSVDERFHFIEKFVKAVAKKVFPSLIITGQGGTGKSFTVVETLKKLGKAECEYGESNDGDFIVIKGYSTAKALYRTLYENNGKIIVFDDSDNIHKDAVGANILKGALDSGAKRVISWGAESRFGDDDLPSRFDFFGAVIFISNLPLSRFPQSLLSRSMKVDLTLNMEETVDRIEYVMSQINVGSVEEKKDTLKFVKENAARFTDLNVRSALNILKLRMIEDSYETFARVALYSAQA